MGVMDMPRPRLGLPAASAAAAEPVRPRRSPADLANQFVGSGQRLQPGDFERAAEYIGCDKHALMALVDVETSSKGGFYRDGFVRCLPERHKFSRFTGGRFDETHPKISIPSYEIAKRKRPDPRRLLVNMASLDETAAIKATSFGIGQVMGYQHALAGAPSPEALLEEAKLSEGMQLMHMAHYIKASGIDGALRTGDFTAFSRGYNGKRQADNGHAVKLAAAYESYSGGGAWKVLRVGATGDAVYELQAALAAAGHKTVDDGQFGLDTKFAVQEFQRAAGLKADGVVGNRTWTALRDANVVARTRANSPTVAHGEDGVIGEAGKVVGVATAAGFSLSDYGPEIALGVVGTGALAYAGYRIASRIPRRPRYRRLA